MLFDLRGKRRRTVQATYLALAVLMGGGLVFFGVGGAGGGLFGDNGGGSGILGGGSGSNKGADVQLKQIAAANKRLAVNPKDTASLGQLVKAHYALATAQADQQGNFLPKAKPELQQTTAAWSRYLDATPKTIDVGLASYAVQAYDGLLASTPASAKKPIYAGLADAYGAVAGQKPSAQAFLLVAQYANAAGKTTIAKRATTRALALAPAKQRKAVQAQASAPPPDQQQAQQTAQPQPVPGTGGK